MEKYRIFCDGKEYAFTCDCSIDYECLKDVLFDFLDIFPQLTVIKDSCPEMLHDNEDLFSD